MMYNRRTFLVLFLIWLMLIGVGVGAVNAASVNTSEMHMFSRLFSTPAERQRLDKLRRENKPEVDVVSMAAEETSKPVNNPLIFNGLVRRSNGEQVMWVNGESVATKQGAQNIRVRRSNRRDNSVVLSVQGGGKTLRMKPGQVWDPATGRVIDGHDARLK